MDETTRTFTVHIHDSADFFAVAALLHLIADHIERGDIPKTMTEDGRILAETFFNIDEDDCCRIGGFRVE